ncbi:MAG: hypothetical protein IKH73_09925 [Erysipelotrichaceae bacterium]|nr:hypothetical protein [Erysipelotrichaceae bacterium]
MSEYKYNTEFIDRGEYRYEGKLIGEVGYKPFHTVYIVAAVALVMLVLVRNTFGLVMGCLFLAYSAYIYIVVPDHKVLEIYDDAVHMMDVTNDQRIRVLPLNIIKSYSVNQHNDNIVSITLDDGQNFQALCFQRNKASRYLKQVLPGKSEENLYQQQLSKMKSSGFSALKRFRK